MNHENFQDIFEPYERLVEIEIAGERRAVPENNSLLRCFQFLAMETVSHGDFCWNGDCANCQVWLREEDDDERERVALACRTKVSDGMKITRLNEKIELAGAE